MLLFRCLRLKQKLRTGIKLAIWKEIRLIGTLRLDMRKMASAFASAIKAGRAAFVAGPMSMQEEAVSSTPEIGRPFTSASL